jgi:DNA-binding LacI/PurR family transcriptional regulator
MELTSNNISAEHSLPKYLKLKQVISSLIDEEKKNSSGNGDKYLLPTEAKLASKYNVSIGTVRKAVDELENEGLVCREQGRGTFAILSQSTTASRRYTGNIGLLIRVPKEAGFFNNEWNSEFYTLLRYYTSKYEYNLTSYSYEILKEKNFKNLIDSKPVDGIIIQNPMEVDGYILNILRENFTCILMQKIPNDELSYCISIDYAMGAKLAVNHLLENGHKDIANIRIDHPENLATKIRTEIYRKVLINNKIEPREELARSVYYCEGNGYDAMTDLLNERQAGRLNFTAVLIDDQDVGIGALKAIKERKLRIPDDISVVVHNDAAMFKFNDPPITCIKEPLKRWTLGLVRNLILRIKSKEVKLHERYLAPELVIRNSVKKMV